MKPRDLRELKDSELEVRIRDTERELSALRMRHRSGGIGEQTEQIRKLRRDIARMKTIAAERERLA